MDADVAVDNLEIGNNQSTIVIDPLAVVNGVQFSGVGCAANGSVSSGSSCTLEKVGWDCTKLTCTGSHLMFQPPVNVPIDAWDLS